MSKNIYAIYRGDTFIVIGDVKECADYLGVTESTIRWYTSPAAKKRNVNNNTLIGIKVDDEE